ncbi:hypothetical protein MRB53_013367 [Persea americana]|uniref:Uncharacterized protein n=1 Tax=Persea americana TaxID=3435 RepID=A0ACC2K843_PERAE|nr:hypothetical protein MRB53_013367 [Persea americana]
MQIASDMSDQIEDEGQDILMMKHEQAFDEVVWNATIITDASTYSEFNWKGDSMEMNMMGQTYLALFFFTIFCLCYLRIFLRQYFPRQSVEKKATGDQDVKSEIEMILLTIIILLILGTGNFGSQLERGIFKSNHKFKGNHFSTTIFAMVVNFPYKVSGEFSPYENHEDNKGHYDELNDKNGKNDMKLRILIPTINTFHEFVKVDRNPKGNGTIVTGYSVEVFKEVMLGLPCRVSYELFPYESNHSLDMGYYDELIMQLHLKIYDGVVGDVTFTYNRSKSGDFTMPYMTSGLSMIVPNAASHAFSLWWFLEPFTWGLWLLIIALFLSGGLLVWIFEHESNIECKGTFREQVGLILSFCFSIFVFERWEMPRSKSSRMVVIVGILVMLVLGVSYSAKLQSRLSIDNDRPTGVEQLIMNGDSVGYQKGSFVFYLLKRMGFQEEKLKAYTSEEYATALSRGSHYNGVSAIVDEIPYIKVFLAKYPDQFTMAELPFSSGGFAFLFQRGCTIVSDVSRGILEFLEGEKRRELEKKLFSSLEKNPSPTKTSQSFRRLSAYDVRGLLLSIVPILGVAVLIFIVKESKRLRDLSSNGAAETLNTEESLNGQLIGSHTSGGSPDGGGTDQAVTPNDTVIEAGDPSDDSLHSNIPPQNISDGVEMRTM